MSFDSGTSPESGQDTHKRQMLRVATKLMVAVGVLAFVVLLLSSMSSSDSVSVDIPSMLVDTSGIKEGQVEYKLWHGRPILIYKRTAADLKALKQSSQGLNDADSEHSAQPEFAKTPLRSLSPEWFVAFSSGTDQGCPIKLLPNRFTDSCRGSSYDLAGRVYADQPAKKNLAVPPYKIKPNGNILLGAGG